MAMSAVLFESMRVAFETAVMLMTTVTEQVRFAVKAAVSFPANATI